MNLGLEFEQFLASVYMLKVSDVYRADMERTLLNKGKSKYNFTDLRVLVQEMMRIHSHKLNKKSLQQESPSAAIPVNLGSVNNIENKTPDQNNK